LYLELFEVTDLGNDIGLMPIISNEASGYTLVLIFITKKGNRTFRPKAGTWVNEMALYTGLKFLPMAYSEVGNTGKPSIFFEVASVSKHVQFCLDHLKVKP